ncbi:accessory regulator AgrB [Clostridium bovifaecis]|uniref:Accessory regulator AgrB n=1 Tax=Clostridium bovifaecis TaxID=2184719 RepID=A0A6I6EXE9_9CLOT|nr:accessory regulator AgrB [Clostridium bovifaecis]
MEKIASKLTDSIYKNNPALTDLELKKIKFGLECFLSEISKILIYFTIFRIFSLTKYFLLALFPFMTLRAAAGGYHEKTYLKCLINSFILMFTIVLIGIKTGLPMYLKGIFILLSLAFIIIYAPVDHYNKPIISKDRRNNLKFTSIGIFILLVLIGIFLGGKLGNTILASVFIESATLPLGYYFNKRK